MRRAPSPTASVMSEAMISPFPANGSRFSPIGPGGGGNRRVAVRHNACGLGGKPARGLWRNILYHGCAAAALPCEPRPTNGARLGTAASSHLGAAAPIAASPPRATIRHRRPHVARGAVEPKGRYVSGKLRTGARVRKRGPRHHSLAGAAWEGRCRSAIFWHLTIGDFPRPSNAIPSTATVMSSYFPRLSR